MFLLCTSIIHSWAYTSCWFQSTGFWFSFFLSCLYSSCFWILTEDLPEWAWGCFLRSLSWASSAHVQHMPTTTSSSDWALNHQIDPGLLPSPFSSKRHLELSFSPAWRERSPTPSDVVDTHISLPPPAPAPCSSVLSWKLKNNNNNNLYISKLTSRNQRTEEQFKFGFFPDLLGKAPIAKTDRQTLAHCQPLHELQKKKKKKKSHFLLRGLLFSWVSQPLKMSLISAGIFAWKVKNPTPRIILLKLWVPPPLREEVLQWLSSDSRDKQLHLYFSGNGHHCNPCWGTQHRPEYLFLALLPVEHGGSRPSLAPKENHHLVKKKKILESI